MRDYKRLTDRTEENFCDAWYCSNGDCDECDAKKNFNRLAELEDKIESGELCDRKETAEKMLNELIDNSNKITFFDCRLALDLDKLAKQFGVKIKE